MHLRSIASSLLIVSLSGCAGAGMFALSADDNNPVAIAQALAKEKKTEAGRPINATGKPMVYLVAAGGSGRAKQLVAWDLARGAASWAVQADVTSRVAVGGSIVAFREGRDKGSRIVARSVVDGAKLWSYELGDRSFFGVAADGDRVFCVTQAEDKDDDGKRKWFLIALERGKEIWRAEAPGSLGAPAARGNLVYMPFMSQWLTMIDAATGRQLARIREEDEEISFVRTTSDGVFYGSRGVFYLDQSSAAGTKAGATYATASLPEFVTPLYHFDAFKSVQADYSAYDRNRVLWRAETRDGKLSFRDGLTVVFSFRFFFAFDAQSGALKWAYQHPRFDVVSAEHVGSAIVYVSQEGELGILDPATGASSAITKIGFRVLGATFDADGFVLADDSPRVPVDTREALASIVWNKDARFNNQKLFALKVLGGWPGADVVKTLLHVLGEESTAKDVYAKAGEVLIARKDLSALPLLIDALARKNDFVLGTRTRAVEMIARAVARIGRQEGAQALLAHLLDPETPITHIKDIVGAQVACKNVDSLPVLRAYLLLNRADPLFAGELSALSSTVDALLALGGPGERETVAYVAEATGTQPKLADYAKRALGERRHAVSPAASE